MKVTGELKAAFNKGTNQLGQLTLIWYLHLSFIFDLFISKCNKILFLGANPDISDSDIHTVASLLKMYLRELPEPLIPYDFFEVFLTSAKCKLIILNKILTPYHLGKVQVSVQQNHSFIRRE